MATIDLTTQGVVATTLSEDLATGVLTLTLTNQETGGVELGTLRVEKDRYPALLAALSEAMRAFYPDTMLTPAYAKTVVSVQTKATVTTFS